MADVKWLGTATQVAQLDTLTVGGTIEIGDIFNITVTGTNGRTLTISVVASSTSIATTVAEIVAAWAASTDDLATAITAADASPDITMTAVTAGDAFTLTVETTESGGGAADAQTFVRAATTANGGPKDWRDVDNWDIGALPGGAGGQDVFIENFSGLIVYGLDQSGIGNTLDSLTIGASFTGKLGDEGAAGTIGDYLQIKATIVNIGSHFGSGSPAGSSRVKVDTGSVASTINVYKSAASTDSAKSSVRLLANNAATDINVYRGNVSIAHASGETTSINDVIVSWLTSRATDSSVFIGPGVTVGGVLTKTGGDCVLQVAVATITHSSGTMTITGSGNITTLNITGGAVASGSSGTIGTLTVTGGSVTLTGTGNITTINAESGTVTVSGDATIGTLNAEGAAVNPNATGTITTLTITAGTVDFTGSLAARTVTTPKLDAGGRLIYDPAVITMTNKIDSDNTVVLTAS